MNIIAVKLKFEKIIFAIKLRQGRSSSIGAKILSFVFRQLTDDIKEENTEKESVQY